MATIYYEILSGEAPFTAELRENTPPYSTIATSTGIGIGGQYFTDVPDGDYIVVITDALGCIDYFNLDVYCPTTSTSTTTTTTTCPPTDCGCIPEFDTYVTPSIAVIDVGVLIGCAYEDYVIDWYDDQNNIVLTTGKTFAHNSIPGHSLPNVGLIHPLTGTAAKPMPDGIYTARIRYVIIGGITYYPDSIPEEPCRMYCPDLNIVIAVIEVTSIQCGMRNLPVGSDYDWGVAYSPAVDYIQYSDFDIELANDDTSGYLAIYFAAQTIPDQVQVWWGPIDTGTLLTWYISGGQISESSEGSPAYLAGNGRKAVVSFNLAPYKPYINGQTLGIRVISNVNINTTWTLYTKCLPDDAFPETTNYFPTSLRVVDPLEPGGLANVSVTRNPLTCIYTMTFDIVNIVMSNFAALQATNFYKYTDLYSYNLNNTVNLNTGHVSVTFDRGTRMRAEGMWTISNDYSNQVDSDGTCCEKGFTYSWDLATHTMSISIDNDPYLKSGVTYYSKYYYDWKYRYGIVMAYHKYGTTRYCNNLPFVNDVQSIYYYKMLYMGWYDSKITGGIDMPCGDLTSSWHNFSFHYNSVVSFMGVPCNPATDITSGGFSASYLATLAALEKVGGVEQVKTIQVVAYDTGAENYTTTTSTTDIYGNGSCDFRNANTWSFIHTGLFKQVEDCFIAPSYSGRSICACRIILSGVYFCEVNNNETVKYVNPFWYTTLKSIMDTTCNALTGWHHATSDPGMLAWEYWYYLAYLKISLNNQYDYMIEDWLDHDSGDVAASGVLLYQPTTTTSTTLP